MAKRETAPPARSARAGRKPRVRRTWVIKPATKPHSTKKGEKGYAREEGKKRVRKEEFADGG